MPIPATTISRISAGYRNSGSTIAEAGADFSAIEAHFSSLMSGNITTSVVTATSRVTTPEVFIGSTLTVGSRITAPEVFLGSTLTVGSRITAPELFLGSTLTVGSRITAPNVHVGSALTVDSRITVPSLFVGSALSASRVTVGNLYAASALTAIGPVYVGASTQTSRAVISKALYSTWTIDAPSLDANVTSLLSQSLAGVAAGDMVVLGVGSSYSANFNLFGYCESADSITYELGNTGGATQNLSVLTLRALVLGLA